MRKSIVLLSFIASLFSACIGKKGEIGPQGAAGAQGSKGDKGNPGANGEFPLTITGNFTVKITDWKLQTLTTKDDAHYFVFPVKEINKTILDKGFINLYWLFNNSPYALPFDRKAYKILYSAYLENGEGRIRIDLYPSATNVASKPSTELNFRWTFN